MRAAWLVAALFAASGPVAAQGDDRVAPDPHRAWTLDTAQALARKGTAREAIAAVYIALSMTRAGGESRANEVLRRTWSQAVAVGGDDPLRSEERRVGKECR